MPDQAEARIHELADALAGGDFALLSTFLAGEFFEHTPGSGEPSAAERWTAIMTDLHEAMPDLTVALEDIQAGDGVFTATMTATGTFQNALWGAPPSGKQVSWTNPISIRPIGDAFAVRLDDVSLPDAIEVLRDLNMINEGDAMDRPLLYPVTFPDFLLKLLMTGRAGDVDCSHLDQIRVTEPATRACAKCVAVGDYWPALRMCLTCGHVGCCDTAINRHANQHYQETGHPLMRSIRMDEGWVWCYEDNAFFEGGFLDQYA